MGVGKFFSEGGQPWISSDRGQKHFPVEEQDL